MKFSIKPGEGILITIPLASGVTLTFLGVQEGAAQFETYSSDNPVGGENKYLDGGGGSGGSGGGGGGGSGSVSKDMTEEIKRYGMSKPSSASDVSVSEVTFRTAKYYRNGDWRDIAFDCIKKGMVVMLFERGEAYSISIATSDARRCVDSVFAGNWVFDTIENLQMPRPVEHNAF
jgi:hypothetical protein